MQEVLKPEVVTMLLERMPGYEARVSGEVGAVRREYYAFLFRTASVSCVQTGLFADPNKKLERPPFVGTFHTTDSRHRRKFDFTLLTVHVLFGNSKSQRRGELEHLAECAAQVLKNNGAERDLIVCGDFNFDPADDGWAPLRALGFSALLHSPITTTVGDVSLYDNFWLLPQTASNFIRRGVVAFDKEWYTAEQTLTARNEISDHRPIWMQVRFSLLV